MNDVKRLDDELERATLGHPWHGPSLARILDDVTAEEAAARPIPNAHTIWELVLHLTAWDEEIARRLNGEGHPLSPAEDWPEPPNDVNGAWDQARRNFFAAHERLRETLRGLLPGRLSEPLHTADDVDGTHFVMLHGVSQHIAYHGGQMSLLKKALRGL